MADERDLLNALRANPADDVTRLVYADWLEENPGEDRAAKAEYLRLEAAKAGASVTRLGEIEARLAAVAGPLADDWLAAVSKRLLENCETERRRIPLPGVEFEYVCPLRWENLRPTDASDIRYCETCKEEVYYCTSIDQANRHAAFGQCVAIDVRQPRTPGDLLPPLTHMIMGAMPMRERPEPHEERGRGRKRRRER